MKVRKKFDQDIESLCEKIAVDLYESGHPPREIVKILDEKGIKNVDRRDVEYWRKKNGSASKYRVETKPRTKKEATEAQSGQIVPDGYIVLPKSNIEELKKLLNLMIAQLEGLEYERSEK